MSDDRVVRVGDVWLFNGDPERVFKVERLWGLKMNGTHECALSEYPAHGAPTRMSLNAKGEPRDERWERVQMSNAGARFDETGTILTTDGESIRVHERGQEVTTVHHLPIDLRVRRLDPRAKLPTYGSEQAAGLDLCALEDVTLTPGRVHRVRTGIAVEIPPGFEGQVRPRSGLTSRGVFVELGTIDSDYRGEVGVLMHAFVEPHRPHHRGAGGERLARIAAGDRIAQLVIAPVPRWRVVEVEELSETARGAGGFGSTGR